MRRLVRLPAVPRGISIRRCIVDRFEPALAAAKPTLFFVAYDRFDTTPPAHQGVFTHTVAL